MFRPDRLGPARGLTDIERSCDRRGNDWRRNTGLRSGVGI